MTPSSRHYSVTSLKTILTTALLDSRATRMFINQELIHKHNLETLSLPHLIPVHNVDGTPNKHRSIMEEVEVILHYGDHLERVLLTVANIGWQSLIIRYLWLAWHNLEINWAKQKIELS